MKRNQNPDSTLLDSENGTGGMLSIKVESDIMAYILYCHYEEFVRIQQTYHVAITWSGKDNNVIICATSHSNAPQLHLATQQFLSFYEQITATLVVVPLSDHVTNITLHQYHKVVHEVKSNHPKAMIKEWMDFASWSIERQLENLFQRGDNKRNHVSFVYLDVKTTGRIALYCPVHEMHAATNTFLHSLNGTNCNKLSSPIQKLYGNALPKSKYSQNLPGYSKTYKGSHRRKELNNQHSKSFAKKSSSPMAHIKSTSTYSQPNDLEFDENVEDEVTDTNESVESDYGKRRKPLRTRFADETESSNGSSGYGSHNGTISRHFGHYDTTMKHLSYSDSYYNSKYSILPKITPRHRLDYFQADTSRQSRDYSPNKCKSRSPDYSAYYYNDIQQSGEASPPNCEQRPSTQGSFFDARNGQDYHHNDRSNEMLPQQNLHNFEDDITLKRPDTMKKTHPTTTTTRQQGKPFVIKKKPSFIPKMESAFRFQQTPKKYFEVTTPTGLMIEILEGDVTENNCDAIVNVTNQQLHVTGELAWAVAKHGSFEIPKLTKLHIAMNGPVMESKVMVTPSVGLPSHNIIHVVAPKWNGKKQKKSRKLLYNTYKNVFNAANLELRAESIALPVIGLENAAKSGDSFPFHVATEVMYQALIAFIKLGSLTLRHIRYIDSDPDRVNLIVTSIKPKIENVTYDSRFLKQIKPQGNSLAMKSVVTLDDDGITCGVGQSGAVTSPTHSPKNLHRNVRTLPKLNDRGKSVKRR